MSHVRQRRHKPLTHTLACAALALGAACTPAAPGADQLDLPAGPGGETLGELGFVTAELADDGTPVYLSGSMSAAARDADEARLLVLGRLGRAFRLAPGTDLRAVASSQDERGLRYFRLEQLHAGVPVAGAEIVVQAGPDGAVLAVLGQLQPDLALEMTPALGGEAAVARAVAGLLGSGGRSRVHEAPSLRVLTTPGEAPRLAYRAVVEHDGQQGWSIDEIFASAGDGTLLSRVPRVHTALDRKIYDFAGRCLTGAGSLPGTLVLSEGGSSMDEPTNAAYDGTGGTYWFYKHFLGRDSFDDAGASLRSTVNATFFGGLSCTGANAAWLDTPYNQMIYGTGDAANFKNFALGFDVTAHELTHAVTSRSSKLTYQNESGALNEAISDILGAGAEAWKASGGGAAGNPAAISASASTWKIGEDVVKPGGMFGDALRYMNNPTVDKQSKDYYPERYVGTQDNGGVHINSGIPNLAFYLLAQGGKHPRDKTQVQVEAISIGSALRIFYLANNKLFTSSTDLRRARFATAQAAVTIHGRCSSEWVNMQRAWDAVGVPGSWSLCARPRPGF